MENKRFSVTGVSVVTAVASLLATILLQFGVVADVTGIEQVIVAIVSIISIIGTWYGHARQENVSALGLIKEKKTEPLG